MNVKDVMTKNVISVNSEEMLTQALAKMKSSRIHQLAVMEGKEFLGFVELKSVITRDVDPAQTKVSNFIKKVPALSPKDEIDSAIQSLILSGMRALPVMENGKIVGIFSETDAIKSSKQALNSKTIKLGEIMSECVYVEKDAKASKIRKLMFDTNISRIPVLDGDNVLGVVGTLDLIKVLEAKVSAEQRGEKTSEKAVTEKMKTSDVIAQSIMSNASILDSDKTIKDALPFLEKNEEIIVKDGAIGIVTPKDLLELILPSKAVGPYVQVTGAHDEGPDFKAKMDKTLNNFLKKHAKMVEGIESFVIHVEKMHKQGPKQKYSIRLRLKAPFGLFVAHSWGWRPLDVMQDAFDNLEREIKKKYEQLQKHQKQRQTKGKFKQR